MELKAAMLLHRIAMAVDDENLKKIKPYLTEMEDILMELFEALKKEN